ncbi:MAG TPA: DNA polymerase III subunit epsilon [Leucothrix mucor]|nr:DNA polymerase III subunit epsilon [Leucothrix mucor]
MSRQILLDTETTGLETRDGHRIIEIGCVEMIDRKMTGNDYHQYIQPDREIDAEALAVHGITPEFLADKPRFAEISSDFIEYVKGAELIIHNAPFDIGFLNYEIDLFNKKMGASQEPLDSICTIIDSLVMARDLHPGQRNSLDALCKRYEISNEHRELHGALLDSQILGDVYLAMTGGQVALSLMNVQDAATGAGNAAGIRRVTTEASAFKVIKANDEELASHLERMTDIEKTSGNDSWKKLY